MIEITQNILGDNQVVELRYYGKRVFSSFRDRRKLDVNKNLSILSATIKKSEQSIRSSSGKGISIGLFIIAVSVFTLIAVKEKSHTSFHLLLPYTFVTILLCLFRLSTSVNVL
ncbi:unnamed protein product [Rotaria sordida]|uniref:Uncharacterized protein n=1 Tax=Rotaria sordida TaxID=392033 RepID=A0A815E5H8_9BILA|nr:unnamed protein product [Rotaria sordida]